MAKKMFFLTGKNTNNEQLISSVYNNQKNLLVIWTKDFFYR